MANMVDGNSLLSREQMKCERMAGGVEYGLPQKRNESVGLNLEAESEVNGMSSSVAARV